MWLSLKHEQDQIDRLHIYKELKNLGQKEQGLNEFQTKLMCHQFLENAVRCLYINWHIYTMKQIRGYQALNYFHRVGHMFLFIWHTSSAS